MLTTRKRQHLQGQGGRKKDKRKHVEDDAPGLLFEDDGVSDGGDRSESGTDDSDPETAAQKRLRLAKAYIERLKEASVVHGDEESARPLLSEQLRAEALEAAGHVQRKIALRLRLPDVPHKDCCGSYGSGRLLRGHRLSATCVALSSNDHAAFTGTKCGSVLQWDLESGRKTSLYRPGDHKGAGSPETGTHPEWVPVQSRRGSARAVYSVATSSDGRYVAAAGGDRVVHLWDARTQEYLRGFRGHKDLISGLAFQRDTGQLFSASFDRSLKLWSAPDRAYMDSLFGHQAELTCVDAARKERCISAGADRTCRLWKIPEEAQLIYRASAPATDCLRYVSGTEWVSGSYDGAVSLWSQTKKKPVSIVKAAHRNSCADEVVTGPGCVDEAAAGWVQSIGVCPDSDLVASGAGDGLIRVWAIAAQKSHAVLEPVGALPARGFVNGLAISRDGRMVVAAVGQEPRLGRWVRDAQARNGTLVCRLPVESV